MKPGDIVKVLREPALGLHRGDLRGCEGVIVTPTPINGGIHVKATLRDFSGDPLLRVKIHRRPKSEFFTPGPFIDVAPQFLRAVHPLILLARESSYLLLRTTFRGKLQTFEIPARSIAHKRRCSPNTVDHLPVLAFSSESGMKDIYNALCGGNFEVRPNRLPTSSPLPRRHWLTCMKCRRAIDRGEWLNLPTTDLVS